LACALAERRRKGKKTNLGFARWSLADFKGSKGAAGAIPAGAIEQPGGSHRGASSRREEEDDHFLKSPWVSGISWKFKNRGYFGRFRVYFRVF
jgi:hypothetical protein